MPVKKYTPKKSASTGKAKSSRASRGPKRILNVLPSKGQDNDWKIASAAAAGIVSAPPTLPTKIDLRADWWKINDQGSTGSCVGWALADSVLRWHFVKANRVPKDKLLSPRFIWMASKETDEFTTQPTTFIEDDGTSLKAALDIARKYGSVRDSVLPFKDGKLYPKDAETFYALASQLKISSYFTLDGVLNSWRTWLATQGPILVRLDVDATWDNSKATGGNLDTYQPATKRGGHAVALVGYTSTRFIVRNSWGTSLWGDKGFGYASVAYAQAAFTEAYGVVI